MNSYLNVVKYLSVSVVQLLIGFASIPIVTNLMSPEELGRFGVFMSATALLVPLLTLCSDSYFPVVKVTLSKSDFAIVKRSTYQYSALFTFIVTIILGLYCYLTSSDWTYLVLCIPIFVFIRGLRLSGQTELVIDERITLFGVSNILISLVSLFLTVLFLLYVSDNALSRVCALLVAELAVLIGLLKYITPISNVSFSLDELKKSIYYSLPLLMSLAPAWVVNEYGRIFVSQHAGLEQTGIFTVALQISAFQLQLNSALSNAFIKNIYSDIRNAFSFSRVFSFLCFLLFMSVSGGLFVYYLAPYVVSSSYAGFVNISLIAFVGVFFQSLAILPSLYANYTKKTTWRFRALFISAISFLVLLYGAVDSQNILRDVVTYYSIAMFIYFIVISYFAWSYYVKSYFA
ncbi:lipopolysaccharide biosynthesis protein [Aeromonas veronii]|uniref:lipopolysaccharide biosynthesis protein n=1 Tax=Aeromonas veronii TaxID=654 RepID=UPI001A904DAC|nr:hypothetical protein [Aeromonas veronii]QSR48373.1 hypothetical protein HUI97_13935 [Aeromonas veronii]